MATGGQDGDAGEKHSKKGEEGKSDKRVKGLVRGKR
jgi:hypothetical protein